MKTFENNKKTYFAYSVIKKSLFIWFVFLIYLRGKGLSYTQALLLDSIAAGVTILFEIPSGIIADRYNRKKLILVGEIFSICNYILLMLFDQYYIFIFGAILNGLGEACVSGSGEALIYDSFQSVNKEKEYLPYIARLSKWGLRCAAVATLISSFLYDVRTELPIFCSIILGICGIIFVSQMKETRESIKVDKAEKTLIKEGLREQWYNLKSITTNKEIIKIFLLFVVMLEIISTINYSSQTFLPYLGLHVKYIGIVFFVFSIVSSFGAKHAAKIKLKGEVMVTVYGGLLILLSLSNIYLAIPLLMISRYINGFIWLILNAETNSMIESHNRATMLSYRSLFAQLAPLVFDPMVGVIFDSVGMRWAYVIMGGVLLFTVLCTHFWKNQRKR